MKIFSKSDIFLALTWVLAFICSLPVIQPYEMARLGAILFISLFLIAGLGRELAGPGFTLQRSAVMWSVLGLAALALASMFWTAAPMITFIVFATFCLFVFGFVVFSSGRGIFRALLPLVPLTYLILCALALWAVIQYFFLPEMRVGSSVRHPFANPNSYAALLMLGFFPAFGWMLAAVDRRVAVVAAIVSAILLAGIIVLTGRAVTVLVIVGIIMMLVGCRGRIRPVLSLVMIVLAVGLGMLSLQYTGLGLSRPVLERTAILFSGDDVSLQARLDIWASTWTLIQNHLWTGTGFGTFFLYYPEMRAITENQSSGLMAHNDLLQFWAEMGILAPALMLLAFGAAIVRMCRFLRCRGPESGERALCLGLFLGAGLVGLHAFVDFNLYVASILALLGLVFGLWLRYTALALGESGAMVALPYRVPSMAGWAAVILPMILLVFFAQALLLSRYSVRQAEQALITNDVEAFSAHVNRGAVISMNINPHPFILAARIPVSLLQTRGDTLPEAERMQLVSEAGALLDRAEMLNPRIAAIYYNRALLARYGFDDEDDLAREWAEEAVRINPRHIPSRILLAELLYEDDQRQEALQILRDGLVWRYGRVQDPHDYYAWTLVLANELDNADAAAEVLHAMVGYERWRKRHGVEAWFSAFDSDGIFQPD